MIVPRGVIDACDAVRRFAVEQVAAEGVPLLHYEEEWRLSAGAGVVIGLLETSFDPQMPDLRGADLLVRDFVGEEDREAELIEHGTFSVTMLIGQGHEHFLGLTPRARLLVGRVVGPYSVADPGRVADGLDWLVAAGARIVALPLGTEEDVPAISAAIDRGVGSGVRFLGAAGSGPNPVLYPARHPRVLAVGPADRDGRLLPCARRAPRLDLAAPGWQIPGLVHRREVRPRSGSSVACVIAAGIAALAYSGAHRSSSTRTSWGPGRGDSDRMTGTTVGG